eukprot:Awhi_evm1s117
MGSPPKSSMLRLSFTADDLNNNLPLVSGRKTAVTSTAVPVQISSKAETTSEETANPTTSAVSSSYTTTTSSNNTTDNNSSSNKPSGSVRPRYLCTYPGCFSRPSKKHNVQRHVWTQHIRKNLPVSYSAVEYSSAFCSQYVDTYVCLEKVEDNAEQFKIYNPSKRVSMELEAQKLYVPSDTRQNLDNDNDSIKDRSSHSSQSSQASSSSSRSITPTISPPPHHTDYSIIDGNLSHPGHKPLAGSLSSHSIPVPIYYQGANRTPYENDSYEQPLQKSYFIDRGVSNSPSMKIENAEHQKFTHSRVNQDQSPHHVHQSYHNQAMSYDQDIDHSHNQYQQSHHRYGHFYESRHQRTSSQNNPADHEYVNSEAGKNVHFLYDHSTRSISNDSFHSSSRERSHSPLKNISSTPICSSPQTGIWRPWGSVSTQH